jgi:hypothetical protein
MRNFGVQKTTVVSSTRKINSISLKYYVISVLILHFNCTKNFGVTLQGKLCLNYKVYFIHSQAFRALGLIRYITTISHL